MAKSASELMKDPNFGLKVIVLIIGILTNLLLIHPTVSRTYYSTVINGYHFSFLTLIGTLVIACIFFKATKITELCLLVAALVKLIIITSFADSHNVHWDERDVVTDSENRVNVGKKDVKYYAFLSTNVVSMILIAINILLRINNKYV